MQQHSNPFDSVSTTHPTTGHGQSQHPAIVTTDELVSPNDRSSLADQTDDCSLDDTAVGQRRTTAVAAHGVGRRHPAVRVAASILLAGSAATVLGGCALSAASQRISKQAQLVNEVQNRQPVSPAEYELEVTTCGVNTELIPKGAEDVPPGEGYEIGFEITNRSQSRQQYEIRFAITSTDGLTTWEPPYLDTNSLDPGETFTHLTQSHVSEAFWNGFTCSLEVWPSVVGIVDRISTQD